jgi:flagellar hook-length control protein FliK
MLKVLHAERAKNALSLPILSYDAAPEDTQISDEFRDLLQNARGAVGADSGNNLSEIVAAAVMAGMMQPTAAQRFQGPVEPRDSTATCTDNPQNGDMGKGEVLSQLGGRLALGDRQADESLTGDREGPLLPNSKRADGDTVENTLEHTQVQQAGAGEEVELVHNASGASVKAAMSQAGEGNAPDNTAALDDISAFSQPATGQSGAPELVSSDPRTVVESKLKSPQSSDKSAPAVGFEGSAPVDAETAVTTQGPSDDASVAVPAQPATLQKEVEERPHPALAQTGRGAFNARDAEISRFVSDAASSAARRSEVASAQMLLLRQSFEHRISHGREGISAPSGASASNSNGLSSNSFGLSGRSGSASDLRERGRAESNPMSRQTALRMLERVQVTLKEAARARDGKTLSINLEPVDLGRIKVDVSLREGALHARLTPENSEVVQRLREHAHELQAALRKLGLDVERVTVTVSGEEAREELPFNGNQPGDGKGFQDNRNNMPRDDGQVVENTFGNELAQGLEAVPDEAKTATTVWRDNWVA